MELIFEIRRHLDKVDLVMLLVVDTTISRHPVVRLRLLQLKREKRVLRWAMGQWCYWRRWQHPRETAGTKRNHKEKIQWVVRHF